MGIAYEKYEYMDKRRLMNALINAEKREEKLKEDMEEKLKEAKELVKFLRAKVKHRINHKIDDDDRTIDINDSKVIQEMTEEFYRLPKEEQERIEAEVRAECGLS